jgi:N-sulfoglucosamine sulfohydrolase
VNFQETHRTFHAPPHADPAKVEIPPYYPDHEVTRKDWAQYLDAATELDRKIGKIMELLKRDGLLENTVICFVGDNGAAHVRGKQFCYEEGLNVPFILSWPSGVPAPAGYEAGKVSDRLLMSDRSDRHVAGMGGHCEAGGHAGAGVHGREGGAAAGVCLWSAGSL